MSEPKRHRHRPEAGDLFRFQVRGGKFGFGRVIAADARLGVFHNGLLVYIYDAFVGVAASMPDLSPYRLLLPPLILTAEMWRTGSFEHVNNRPVTPADRLPVHCFRDHLGRYWNEKSEPLAEAVEPVGEAAITTPGGFQRAVAERLDERESAS